MKKIKLQLDKDVILEFLLQNAEKIVLGLVVLIFLSLVYSAIANCGRFDKEPKQLEDEAASSQRAIDSTPPEIVLPPLPPSRDYPAEASRSRDPIRENWYVIGRWDNELFEKRPLRDTPPFYPVQDLRVAAGMGAFHAVAAAEGGAAGGVAARPAGGTSGKRWVVVTGLVPWEKQDAAYAEVLRQSVFRDPQKDSPEYFGYLVQRVEVNSAGDAAKPDWENATRFISVEEERKALSEWSASSKDSDVVDPRFLVSHLAFPLGPLDGEHWDGSVAHEPEIGLVKKEKPSGSAGGHASPGRQDSREAPAGGRERAPASDSNPFGDESKPEAVAKTVAGPAADVAEEQKDLGYRLFRFFDFTVEPGKRYIYRVKLAVANPNYLLKPTVLKKAELAQKKCLMTDWSEPSPIISMPRDTQVLVNAVKPAPRANTEPTFQVTVVKWLIRSGVKVSYDSPVMRGQLANFGDIQKREAGGPVNFFSDTTVVDLRGGEHLGKKGSAATSPGEILLVDADGSLSVRNEVDDSAACRQLTEAPAPEAAPRQPQVMPKAGAAPAPAGRGFGALVTPPTTPRKPRR